MSEIKNFFPTEWQRVVYRNYGIVPSENIAKVIKATAEIVEKSAAEMGLTVKAAPADWAKKGFVTIIRENWDILPNEDICTLLGISEKEFAVLYSDYDFLYVKLGEKPAVHTPQYSELTEEQKSTTRKIKEITERLYKPLKAERFDFFDKYDGLYEKCGEDAIKDRFTSCYSANYSGALLDDELSDYSDDYLKRLSLTGTNGLWIQETLRNLAEFPFDKKLSENYERRVKNLKKLTERAAAYGLNIYLYLNEPRSLPAEFFDKYPEFKGQKTSEGEYCLCTSVKEVRDYIYNAVYSVVKSVPLLKGVLTITMSENPTHCYSRKWNNKNALSTDCPRCAKREPEEVVAELNNVMCAAVKDANPETLYIANLWSWADFMGWSEKRIMRGVDLLDKRADVMCVSEFDKKFRRGGVKSRVIDYSISVIGPSDITVKTLKRAKLNGHRIWAKIQINNSWECSAVPFIPAFDNMVKHIENLKELGVSGLMTGWSLGGYPSGAMSLCNEACAANGFDEEKWFKKAYGNESETVRNAVKIFCNAFAEFPFSIENLYLGYQNIGVANLWNENKDDRISTMVCYTFDDYKTWSKPYGLKIYLSQYQKLCDEWEKGLILLEDSEGNDFYKETKDCAEAVYVHYKSTLLFARFCKMKKRFARNAEEIINLCREEQRLVNKLYRLISENPRIGFEMTNHYYYTPNRLCEKYINLEEIISRAELENV